MPETATTVFPEIDVQWDNEVGILHSTDVLGTPEGREQRIPRFPVDGYRRFSFTTGPLDQRERHTLYTFINACRGSAIAFYVFEPFPRNYYSEPVGTVAGSSLVIPYRQVSATEDDAVPLLSCEVAAVSKAFTVTESADVFGDARLNFTGAQAGATTLSARMRKRYIGRFETDENVERFVQNALSYRTNVRISIRTL